MHDQRPLSLVLLFAVGACSAERGSEAGTWLAEFDTIGDTVVVHTISGSVWGEPLEMVVDLSIGVLDGAEELMLGSIGPIAVDERGGIYAFDRQVPALRYFNAAGEYVRTVGGEGGGPGEYRDYAGGLAVRHDGKILLHDPQNSRINLYEPDGTPVAGWPLLGALGFGGGLAVDSADHVFLQILTGTFQSNEPLPSGYLHLDPHGETVDTIHSPRFPDEPDANALSVFGPNKVQAWSPLGCLIVGMNDEYSFDVRRPGGRVVRIEREYEPVKLLPEERADWEAYVDWFESRAGMEASIRPVPDHKPPFRGFLIGGGGRIWVRLYTEGVKEETAEPPSEESNQPPPINWEEPAAYDVFEHDGTYLGRVHLPPRTSASFVRGDTAWGVRRGEFDEQYIVRMVIAPAGPGATD